MHATLAVIGAFATVALAQGVTENITPSSGAPDGCSATYSGKFEITATKAKRDLEKRACGAEGSLTISLAGGKLLDAQSRTGYIASNYQFQFDGPPQAGAIYTGGFSVCGNGSLALGGSTVFYQCLSGSFYNLYDRSWAAQCDPIHITVLPCGGSAVAPTQAGQIGDGQVQSPSAIPIAEIADGQPQMPSGLVSQINDGQVQVPTSVPAPVTQIGDGQVQAPTSVPAPVTQIGDGQVQAPTSVPAPITQIGDGQVQAPTSVPVISQIGDGQVQAPTSVPAPISQIGDGQVQAPTGASNASMPAATPSPSTMATSGASFLGSSFAFALAGVAAVLML